MLGYRVGPRFASQKGGWGVRRFVTHVKRVGPLCIGWVGPWYTSQFTCDNLSHWHDFTWQRIVVRGATFCAFTLARQV